MCHTQHSLKPIKFINSDLRIWAGSMTKIEIMNVPTTPKNFLMYFVISSTPPLDPQTTDQVCQYSLHLTAAL